MVSISFPSPTRSSSNSARSRRSSLKLNSIPSIYATALIAITLCSSYVIAQAPYEPPGNQVIFGAWIDTAAGYSDTPTKFNQRLGQNVPVYQIAQDIPLIKYNFTTGAGGAAPENLIELSQTDAAVFITVYPVLGFAAVTLPDIQQLGAQILNYQADLNRTVFLRYAPEMQGLWNVGYGQQPTAFIASWRLVYDTIKAIAPLTIFVWAPNTSQGYPYGQNFLGSVAGGYPATTPADRLLLDTNNSNGLDPGDDAFAPYYPGDAYVDWIGVSLYYKGPNGRDVNVAQPGGYCANAITGISPDDGSPITPWYSTYCLNKPTKACMFSESGAAYHVDVPGGVSNAALHQAWAADCITNTTFLDLFPRLKLIMQFEYEKYEISNTGTNDLRDFRLTNDTSVLAEIVADFVAIGTRYSWAQSRAAPTSISSPGAPAPTATDSQGSTISIPPNIITATTRARPTGFPALFGNTSSGMRREIIELVTLVLCGVLGSVTVMKML